MTRHIEMITVARKWESSIVGQSELDKACMGIIIIIIVMPESQD